MNRLSIRMILFIAVLSTLHISAIAPLKPPAIGQSREAPSRTMVQTREPQPHLTRSPNLNRPDAAG
jgi:hypothetical protein